MDYYCNKVKKLVILAGKPSRFRKQPISVKKVAERVIKIASHFESQSVRILSTSIKFETHFSNCTEKSKR